MTDNLSRNFAQTDTELENRFRPLLEKERAELEESIAAIGDKSGRSDSSGAADVSQFGVRKEVIAK